MRLCAPPVPEFSSGCADGAGNGDFRLWGACRGGEERDGLDSRHASYLIIETDVTDPEQYERYKAAGAEAVAAAGGRYLVRGGELAVLEGDWEPSRLVVLEFEDLEAAKRWYDSERYRQARTLREGAARLRMVAVQGVE